MRGTTGTCRLYRALLATLPLLLLLWPGSAVARQETGDAPVPVELPRDDGPHAVPLEWWYYTGHLLTESGDRYGFEFVVFKAVRSDVVAYASHFAVTDNVRGEFHYEERLIRETGGATPVPDGGFDLRVGDWRMSGSNGDDRLIASMEGYAISLTTNSEREAVLHDGDGYIAYGDGEYSYYYSRTRLALSGALRAAGEVLTVEGQGWMDHQWGDFPALIDAGWDWFAIQLDDGRDLMLYLPHEDGASAFEVDGTLVASDGEVSPLDGAQVRVAATGEWTSPRTGATYPSGWTVELPEEDLRLVMTPALLDQELDTSYSTGQIYWEGQITVEGSQGGEPVTGLAYVELTGYAG